MHAMGGVLSSQHLFALGKSEGDACEKTTCPLTRLTNNVLSDLDLVMTHVLEKGEWRREKVAVMSIDSSQSVSLSISLSLCDCATLAV